MGTYYCDWENGAAHPTGDGSSGNPYRSIDDVFNNKTQDTDTTIYLSGNQLEVRTSEIGAALTGAGWSTSANYVLTLIGVDGSSTGFDGDGTYAILSSGGSTIGINLEITNSGSNVLWSQSTGGTYATGLLNCYLHNSSSATTPVVTSALVGCRVENVGSGTGTYAVNANMFNCFVDCNGTNSSDYGATGANFVGNMIVLNGSPNASQAIGLNESLDGQTMTQNTIYRATGATKKAWGIFCPSSREALHLQGNLIVYSDSVTGDVGVYSHTDQAYVHNCGFHNVADHVFNVSHIVGDPGLQSVTIASNPYSSTPTATYSSWEPTSTGIDGLRGTATGNQGYDNIGADYIGAWQPAGGGGAGVVVPQGLHGIETGIIA